MKPPVVSVSRYTIIAAPGESDAAIGLGREGEEANDVGASRRRLENDPRIAADVVVILGQHQPILRDNLEHGIHRRAEVALRLDASNEGLAARQADRETVHVSRLGQAAVDSRRRDGESLRSLRLVIRLDLDQRRAIRR